MKRLYLLLLVLFVIAAPASAQFEGEVRFNLEQYLPNQTVSTEFRLISADERLMISSQKDVNVITGLKSDGLLVRNDLQDFVFNTGQNQAIKVSKADLDGLMNLLDRFSGNSGAGGASKTPWKDRIIETENSRQHLGFDVTEFRLMGEKEGQYASIWLTNDIKVLWGLMTDVWKRAGRQFSDSDFPVELIMNSNSFPMLVEVFDNDRLVAKFESVSVETENFDRSAVELPNNKQLIGLTELMMNMFRQQ